MSSHYRICIIGNAGSGKSTLAHLLGEKLSLPVFHLDTELLTSEFKPKPREQQKEIHRKLVNENQWIIEGNYKYLLPDRLERATLVVFLDVPRLAALVRVIKRSFKTPPQRLSWRLIKMILTYSRTKKRRSLQKLCTNYPNVDFIILTNDSPQSWQTDILTRLQQAKNV